MGSSRSNGWNPLIVVALVAVVMVEVTSFGTVQGVVGGFSRLLGSGRARLASSERRVLVRTGYRSVNMFFCTRTR